MDSSEERKLAVNHLDKALEAETTTEKDYQIREALQLLNIGER